MSRTLRADARRNRARLLEVADRVFTERGVGAPTEEVARAAGVGIGTVFRHFPTKEALLEAVYVARLRRLKTDDRPLLLKINLEVGHGGASGRFDALREIAEDDVFLLVELGLAA